MYLNIALRKSLLNFPSIYPLLSTNNYSLRLTTTTTTSTNSNSNNNNTHIYTNIL